MPLLGIGLHVVIALFFAIHAIKSRQNSSWVYILFGFPLLGSIVYFFAVFLPEIRQSRMGYVAARAITSIIDPARELRMAQKAFELTPTVGNRIRLATALLEAGKPASALEQYQQAASGPFSTDPELLMGMARTWLALDDSAHSLATIEKLHSQYPQYRQHAATALLYARALAGTNSADTRAAFDVALTVGEGQEVKCRYADWLTAQDEGGDRDKARALYEDVISDSRYWNTRYSKLINRPWLQHARQALEKAKAENQPIGDDSPKPL
ncbi:MAG: hypothetical protein LBB76_12130 [Azoarcus sp.]|jgi:hypothetical protein|nr:hypothetical protein [Azoarcus sp.]